MNTVKENFYNKLIKLSEEDYYNPLDYFNWPEKLDGNQYWMSPELLSVYGTPYFESLTETEKMRLSKYELLNFFSMSVNGEKNIKMDMLKYMNKSYFVEESKYFIHFLMEENSHIYFFSRFCNTYGGKLYEYKKLNFNGFGSYVIDRYVIFAQTLIAEEIGDYINIILSKDQRLPAIVREINERHHIDESRHMAMGRQIAKDLWYDLVEQVEEEKVTHIKNYLAEFIRSFILDLYHPNMYKDYGFENGLSMRNKILANNNKLEFHRTVSKRIVSYMQKHQMLEGQVF